MIKKRFLSMLVLLAAVATGAWAQTYKVSVKEGTTDATSWTITPAEATLEDIGKIAGADGNIYDSKDAAEAANTTAVAMIAYVGSSTDHATYKHGLAIALSDDTSGSNWSTAMSTIEGKSAVTNAAWQLPSQNQWKAMFKAFGDNEASYSGLNSAITTAEGAALQEDAYYWASSEYDADNAWNVHPLDGSTNLYYYSKDYDFFKGRACLAF